MKHDTPAAETDVGHTAAGTNVGHKNGNRCETHCSRNRSCNSKTDNFFMGHTTV